MKIDIEENFEPCKKTRDLWLYTRKLERTFEGLTLPGLFQTYGFQLDSLGTLVVLFLEIMGLSILIKYSNIQIVHAIFLFFADIVSVLFKQYPARGKICKYQNLKILASNPADVARLKTKIKIWDFWAHLWAVPIILIAFFKITIFYAAVGLSGITVLICLTYSVVAVLHIVCTGYFIAHLAFAFFYWLDYRAFLGADAHKVNKVLEHRKHVFETDKLINIPDVRKQTDYKPQKSSHEIVQTGNTEYTLFTWGLLTDDDRDILIGKQIKDGKRTIAVEILRHQIENILEA